MATKRISVQLNEQEYQRLEARAREEGRPVANMATWLLQVALGSRLARPPEMLPPGPTEET